VKAIHVKPETEQKLGPRYVLLSVAQAAQRLRISRRQYYKLAAMGRVPKPTKICGNVSVPAEEIDELIAAALAKRNS
jgi:predicted DNA-binding transcriptional regulator AlpA